MANSVLCVCNKKLHGRCAKIKRVTLAVAEDVVCERCVETTERIVKPGVELSFYDQVEFIKSLCFSGTD